MFEGVEPFAPGTAEKVYGDGHDSGEWQEGMCPTPQWRMIQRSLESEHRREKTKEARVRERRKR